MKTFPSRIERFEDESPFFSTIDITPVSKEEVEYWMLIAPQPWPIERKFISDE